MNILERLLGHDRAATHELLDLCMGMTDDELDREFDVGWRTLRKTFNHMISNIEVWADLMMEHPVRSASDQVSAQALLDRLESSYGRFAAFAPQMESEGRLDDLWTDILDNPPVQKSFGGAIGHVITHNMHHRAEIQHILHRLGVPNVPEGDLMGWDQRRRLGQ